MIFAYVLRWLMKGLAIVAVIVALSWLLLAPPSPQRGVWRTVGFGQILDIGFWRIKGYQVTSISCDPIFTFPAHRLFMAELSGFRIENADDELQIWKDGRPDPIQAKRVANLPSACEDNGVALPADEILRVISQTVGENMPHLDHANWDQATDAAIAKAQSGVDLWAATTDMLSSLPDKNVFLYNPDEPQVFAPARTGDWERELLSLREVIQSHPMTAIPETGIEYTILPDNIGYIFLRHTDTRTGLGTLPEDIAQSRFETVADVLRDTDFIILDNRANPGGEETVALSYASFFFDTPQMVLQKRTQTAVGLSEAVDLFMQPSPAPLNQPLVVLQSRYTSGAGEVISEILSERPNTKVVGEGTDGQISPPSEFILPNGWVLGIPNQIYYAPDGSQVTGVNPNAEIDENLNILDINPTDIAAVIKSGFDAAN